MLVLECGKSRKRHPVPQTTLNAQAMAQAGANNSSGRLAAVGVAKLLCSNIGSPEYSILNSLCDPCFSSGVSGSRVVPSVVLYMYPVFSVNFQPLITITWMLTL